MAKNLTRKVLEERIMSKCWQCTVCGYVHNGEAPPEVCPVCAADRAKFIPLKVKSTSILRSLITMFKLHSVAAHFPGGLIPTAAFFLLLFLTTGNGRFESATFLLLMVATTVVPVSLGSGIHAWRKYFGGRRATIFFRKVGLAITLFVLGLLVMAIRFGRPDLFSAGGWPLGLYLVCLAGMLACVVFLGHYGAILVSRGLEQGSRPSSLASTGITADWFETIVTLTPDAVLVADPTGVIRLWNHGAERIFGIPAKEATGQSLDLIVPETLRQRHWEGWGKVMRTGESRYGAHELLRVPALRGDGSRFSAEFSIVMLKDKAGVVTGVAAVLRDVSEQWEREKQLKAQLTACREHPPN